METNQLITENTLMSSVKCSKCDEVLMPHLYKDTRNAQKVHRKECKVVKEAIKGYMKEYSIKNKDKINERRLKRRADNPELYKTKQRENYKKNRDKILERKRLHYQENKEENNEKNKAYYHKNKNAILEKKKEKIECICGITYSRCNKAQHEKTYRHLNYNKTPEPKTISEEKKQHIKDRKNEKMVCECGSNYTRCNKTKHFKTTRHKEWLEKNVSIE